MLVHRNTNPTSFLKAEKLGSLMCCKCIHSLVYFKESVIVPVGIEFGESLSYQVVKPDKNDMQNGQLGIFIGTMIT